MNAEGTRRTILAVLVATGMGAGCDNAATAVIGDACTEKEDCVTGLCSQENRYGQATGWADGYCTARCTTTCPAGSRCVELVADSLCLSLCTTADDCRDGYVCSQTDNVCLPDCRLGWSCGTELTCSDNGECLDDETIASLAGTHELGGPCEADADCASGYCITERTTSAGVSWSAGTCTQPCGECPLGYGCVTLDAESWCLPWCSGMVACREGYACHPGERTCLPDCNLGFECSDGLVCRPEGACLMAPPNRGPQPPAPG